MRKVFLEEEKRPCFPEEIRRMVQGSALYDSSCGDTARVYYADNGLYIKTAAAGPLPTKRRWGKCSMPMGWGRKCCAIRQGSRTGW